MIPTAASRTVTTTIQKDSPVQIDHDAVAQALALQLADDTEWDQPPRVYWLMTTEDGVRLEEATVFAPVLATVMERGVRLRDALRQIADQLLTLFRDGRVGAAADCLGVVVRTEAWGVETPADPSVIADPVVAEAAALAEQAAAGGRLSEHPDAVELATFHAVTVDEQFHWHEWQRGGIEPVRRQVDLTTTPPPGDIPRVLRRLARIVRHHQDHD